MKFQQSIIMSEYEEVCLSGENVNKIELQSFSVQTNHKTSKLPNVLII